MEQRINEEMDQRMAQMGKKIEERDAHFSEANQRLADEAELANAVESEHFTRTREEVAEVRGWLVALETEKGGKSARVEGLAHATEKAAEQAENAAQNVR